MTKFTEAFKNSASFFLSRQEQQALVETVLPVTDEQQKRLEQLCLAILEKGRFSSNGQEFIAFVHIMIDLLGGILERTDAKKIKQTSSVLYDYEQATSVVLSRTSSQTRQLSREEIKIFIENEKLSQTLEYDLVISGSPTVDKKIEPVSGFGPVIQSSFHVPDIFTFDSYISNQEENLFPSGQINHSRRFDFISEGPSFCRRLFDLYRQTRNAT